MLMVREYIDTGTNAGPHCLKNSSTSGSSGDLMEISLVFHLSINLVSGGQNNECVTV